MDSNAVIGERIAELRKSKDLTQDELSKIIHVKRETVCQWENGTRDLKSGYIISLADALETDCDYILRGTHTENVCINQQLGLSDNAISELRNQKQKADDYLSSFEKSDCPKETELFRIVNLLISSGTVFNAADYIDDYCGNYHAAELRYNEIIAGKSDHVKAADDFHREARFSALSVQDVFSDFLSTIGGELKKLKRLQQQANESTKGSL